MANSRRATLGSLFDGISGFNVCWARIHGAECCRWSCEIEQFPIAVTKKHFGDEKSGEKGDWDVFFRRNDMVNDALFSSDKNFWETPQKLFDELDAEFHFTLDAAASDENHKCARYFTQNDDGLRQNWGGETVFCNPPYGSKETGLWTEKCCREGQKPGTTVVLLIPARTDRASFHDYILGKAEIRFLRGRLKFELDGKPMGTAPFPSMIAIWRGGMT